MNFVSGEPLNERNRVEVMIDDQGLYRETQVRHPVVTKDFHVSASQVVRWRGLVRLLSSQSFRMKNAEKQVNAALQKRVDSDSARQVYQ